MPLPSGLHRVVSAFVLALLAVSCESPPNKEMDQAQGAIDAARAAGAEQYAPKELTSAREALQHATEAVAARDYRLALNYALTSQEQAQNAARSAADSRAELRGDVERSMAEVKALLTDARARFDGPAGAQVPRPARRRAQQTIAQVENSLQETDAAVQKEDYSAAQGLLTAAKERIQTLMSTSTPPENTQSAPRRK